MKTKIFLLAAIISAFFLSQNILAQGFGERPGDRNRERDGDRIKEKLNLTDEQSDKIEELRLKHRKDIISLAAEIELKELELEELKEKLNFSREEFINKTNEILSVKNKLALARANHHMDIYQLLDEKQKKEWNKMTRMLHDRKHEMVRKMRGKDFN